MEFLTNEKLTIVGAAGMIGSNMVQTALTMRLTNDICLYDVFSPEGVAEEMRQSGFGEQPQQMQKRRSPTLNTSSLQAALPVRQA